MNHARAFLAAGALAGGLAVAAGAFGEHALRSSLAPDALAVFETAARYQMYHALALVATAWAATAWPSRALRWAGWLFVCGIVVFSGSLYGVSLAGVRWLGAVTPVGGAAMIAGWACLAYGAWRAR